MLTSSAYSWVAELFTYSKVGAAVAALEHCATVFKVFMRCLPTENCEAAEANYNWGVEKTHRRLGMDDQREFSTSAVENDRKHDDLSEWDPWV